MFENNLKGYLNHIFILSLCFSMDGTPFLILFHVFHLIKLISVSSVARMHFLAVCSQFINKELFLATALTLSKLIEISRP